MKKIVDKIVYSHLEPEDKYVIWYDTVSQKLKHWVGDWVDLVKVEPCIHAKPLVELSTNKPILMNSDTYYIIKGSGRIEINLNKSFPDRLNEFTFQVVVDDANTQVILKGVMIISMSMPTLTKGYTYKYTLTETHRGNFLMTCEQYETHVE